MEMRRGESPLAASPLFKLAGSPPGYLGSPGLLAYRGLAGRTIKQEPAAGSPEPGTASAGCMTTGCRRPQMLVGGTVTIVVSQRLAAAPGPLQLQAASVSSTAPAEPPRSEPAETSRLQRPPSVACSSRSDSQPCPVDSSDGGPWSTASEDRDQWQERVKEEEQEQDDEEEEDEEPAGRSELLGLERPGMVSLLLGGAPERMVNLVFRGDDIDDLELDSSTDAPTGDVPPYRPTGSGAPRQTALVQLSEWHN
ncbi:hypothetical protein FJT64_017481 [Amphibalanus amphitrite]|uniref:Uncharacterized protein n=1 Tax=Amphibalanus amphitrite TaxID=1232801 RepID=A0A6A4X9K8_AMPAM|nr:hypothetical protein FJT64_017481 [Amphibalanus amphitrite]